MQMQKTDLLELTGVIALTLMNVLMVHFVLLDITVKILLVRLKYIPGNRWIDFLFQEATFANVNLVLHSVEK